MAYKSIVEERVTLMAQYLRNVPVATIVGYGTTSRQRRLVIKGYDDTQAESVIKTLSSLPLTYTERDDMLFIRTTKDGRMTKEIVEQICQALGEYFSFIVINQGAVKEPKSKIYMSSSRNIFGEPADKWTSRFFKGLEITYSQIAMEKRASRYRFYRDQFFQNKQISDFSKALSKAFNFRNDWGFGVDPSGKAFSISYEYHEELTYQVLDWVIANHPVV